MADISVRSVVGGRAITDRRKAVPPSTTPDNPVSSTTFNATKDVASMRTALAAANGAYYTATRLQSLTVTDMEFALRTINDAAGLP